MEYYSTMRKNEISPFATIKVDLEDIMLVTLSQIETDRTA